MFWNLFRSKKPSTGPKIAVDRSVAGEHVHDNVFNYGLDPEGVTREIGNDEIDKRIQAERQEVFKLKSYIKNFNEDRDTINSQFKLRTQSGIPGRLFVLYDECAMHEAILGELLLNRAKAKLSDRDDSLEDFERARFHLESSIDLWTRELSRPLLPLNFSQENLATVYSCLGWALAGVGMAKKDMKSLFEGINAHKKAIELTDMSNYRHAVEINLRYAGSAMIFGGITENKALVSNIIKICETWRSNAQEMGDRERASAFSGYIKNCREILSGL